MINGFLRNNLGDDDYAEFSAALYSVAAAGTAPEPTKTVDRAWSRFCGCIGRGPDAPYPGMIEAFESHYGQNFTDKDWRNEAGIWAAAWGYATRQAGAAPVPCVVLTPEERAAFERFHETWEDNEGYDVPKEMMRRLAEVGVVHHITAGRYDITKFGHYVLAAGAAPVPDGYRLVSIAQLNTWGVYDEETTPKDAP